MSELFVLFEIGESTYAIAARDVVQMESFTQATAVPGAPPHVRGVMQVRGQVLPVVDVRVRFGLEPAEPSLERRVVVVRQKERAVALLVDRAREIAYLGEEALEPPPDLVAREAAGFVTAIAQHGERPVMQVDVDRIIFEDEHGRQRTE